MKRILAAAALALLAWASPAEAQSSCPTFTYGAVLTAGQWQACFDAKQNALGYTPVNRAGDIMQGPLITFPSALASTGFSIPPGVAPTAPNNGDFWATSAGLYYRVAGVTVGPLSGATSSSFAGTSPIGVTFPAGVVTYAFDFTVANTFLAQQTDQGATTTSPGWYVQLAGDTTPRVRVGLNGTDVPSIAFGPGNAVRDAFIERAGAANLRYGAPDAAAPVGQTLSVQNVVAGTSNAAGANLTIAGSQGTGTGAGGSVIVRVAPAGSTGSAVNALADALTIDSTKKATFTGAVSVLGGTSIPAGGTAGAGLLLSSTSNFGTFFGSGAPTLSAAQGSLYLRSDGGVGTRAYVNSNGTTGYVALADVNVTTLSSLASVGTLTSGGTGAGFTVALGTSTVTGVLTGTNGGTGINNGASTITLGGSLSTAGALTHAGAFATTITATNTTNSTLPAGTHTLAGLDVAQTFSAAQIDSVSLAVPIIGPIANSTTAVRVTKADLSTNVMVFDTTNARVGINKTPGAFDLDVNGAVNVGGALTAASIVGPLATSSVFGAVKVDGTTITASGGVISAIGASATDVHVGVTTVTAASASNILFNNGGLLGAGTIASFLTAGTGIAITGTTNAALAFGPTACTSYTPTDQSGAGLAFTSVSVQYCQYGNIVYVYGTLTFPSTADGSTAKISLPVAVPNQNYAQANGGIVANLTQPTLLQAIKNTSAAQFYNTITALYRTNAALSTTSVSFFIAYPAS